LQEDTTYGSIDDMKQIQIQEGMTIFSVYLPPAVIAEKLGESLAKDGVTIIFNKSNFVLEDYFVKDNQYSPIQISWLTAYAERELRICIDSDEGI